MNVIPYKVVRNDMREPMSLRIRAWSPKQAKTVADQRWQARGLPPAPMASMIARQVRGFEIIEFEEDE